MFNNFTWNHHIRYSEKAIIHILNKKNAALGKLSKVVDFKTRKMI